MYCMLDVVQMMRGSGARASDGRRMSVNRTCEMKLTFVLVSMSDLIASLDISHLMKHLKAITSKFRFAVISPSSPSVVGQNIQRPIRL